MLKSVVISYRPTISNQNKIIWINPEGSIINPNINVTAQFGADFDGDTVHIIHPKKEEQERIKQDFAPECTCPENGSGYLSRRLDEICWCDETEWMCGECQESLKDHLTLEYQYSQCPACSKP
jgi:hypothetical protein